MGLPASSSFQLYKQVINKLLYSFWIFVVLSNTCNKSTCKHKHLFRCESGFVCLFTVRCIIYQYCDRWCSFYSLLAEQSSSVWLAYFTTNIWSVVPFSPPPPCSSHMSSRRQSVCLNTDKVSAIAKLTFIRATVSKQSWWGKNPLVTPNITEKLLLNVDVHSFFL